MPTVTNINQQAVFIGPQSSIESMNEASLIYGGQLGVKVKVADKRYQLIQVDSGSTAAADTAPAASLVAYWKDKGNFLVTTDRRFTEGGGSNSNALAGIFTNAITPGNYGFIHKEGKRNVTFAGGVTPTQGEKAYGNAASATGASANRVAAGTAVTYSEIGDIMATGAAASTVSVDVYIPD